MMSIVSPLGISNEIRESPPWSFTLTIPKDTSVGGGAPLLGKHPVYADVALAVRDSNAKVGASIIVDVERPDMPSKLWTQDSEIVPEAFGEDERRHAFQRSPCSRGCTDVVQQLKAVPQRSKRSESREEILSLAFEIFLVLGVEALLLKREKLCCWCPSIRGTPPSNTKSRSERWRA
jgi:hypothetical protein